MPALPVHVGDPADTQQFCDYLSLFQEGEQSGSGQHVLSNLHFRGMEGKERSTLLGRKLSLNCLFAGRNNNNSDLCRPPGN